jgi:hypothetical protein
MFFIKVIVSGLMPFIGVIIASIMWSLIYLYKKYKDNYIIQFKQNIKVTFIIIAYLIYPTICNLCFSLFNCYKMDDGKSYLRRDLSVECMTRDHLRMSLGIGLPYILIWVIGFPLYIFRKLYKFKDRFDDKNIIMTYGLFFVGLSDNAYFWEIVITNTRKIIFIICSTMLSTTSPLIKALIGVFILFF